MSRQLDKSGKVFAQIMQESINVYYFRGKREVQSFDAVLRCEHGNPIDLKSLPAFHKEFFEHRFKECHVPKDEGEVEEMRNQYKKKLLQ